MPRRTKGSLEREVRAVLTAASRPLTPGQVRDALGGDLAYTTVLTVLTRLFEKGEVARETLGRGYAYTAPYDSAELAARRMALMLDDEADRQAVLTRFVHGLQPDDEHLLRGLLGQ